MSLQEDDENQIKENVFTQISLDDLEKEIGLDKLIKFLDTHLKKRMGGQSVSEYIALFDFKYRKIKKFNMKLPSEILAFKLIRRAKISRVEKKLVLTGINFNSKDSSYEEAKRSLKKFVGDITGMGVSQESDVKLQTEIS